MIKKMIVEVGVGGKWRQLYLNNNKKNVEKNDHGALYSPLASNVTLCI